jgi:hypothetical protein
MDMQGGLRARLLADAAVAAAVGSRVYWVQRPQSTALPAITMQTIDDPRPNHMQGFDGARTTRVQLDCWAPSFSAALTLARACIAALAEPTTLNGKRFGPTLIDGQRDLLDDVSGTPIHRQSVDLLVWHVGD